MRARGRERSVGDVESRGRFSGRNTCRRWCDKRRTRVDRRRGAGPERGRFPPTCGIGIGGTNFSSLCATGIANGAKKPDAGGGTSGAARAWLSQSMGRYDGTEQRLRHPVSGMAADVTRRSGTSAPRSRANWPTITEIRVKRAPLRL